MHFDLLVLGAGIVGVSCALHLQRRGVSVALVDRRGPGEETSFGNAGVVEASGLLPLGFPRQPGTLARVALKRSTAADYRPTALPALAPWLLAYARASRPRALEASARALRPLLAGALAEHLALARLAGTQAESLYSGERGWITLYRSESSAREAEAELALAREYGLDFQWLDPAALRRLQPGLGPVYLAGTLWRDAQGVRDPGALTAALAAAFRHAGGTLLRGDARTLRALSGGWSVDTAEGPCEAAQTVVALGPWSGRVLQRLGLRVPLAVKRGYHRHFRSQPGHSLHRPLCDKDAGFCLAPMQRGLRLTSGVEFAPLDAPPATAQLARLEPVARQGFPLGEAIDSTPWMGSRPCLPDSLPLLGPVARRPGLWLAFGHQHWGFTLGPVSGRLLAEMLCGETPFCDPAPYALERFGAAASG